MTSGAGLLFAGGLPPAAAEAGLLPAPPPLLDGAPSCTRGFEDAQPMVAQAVTSEVAFCLGLGARPN